jgi:extradiol dioxygenase family protein
MAMEIGHVHIKTKDPKETMQFYIDNFGATLKRDVPGRGFQLDLHGLQLNVTTIIDTQKHQQHLGIEHIAVQTDDYAGTLPNCARTARAFSRRRRATAATSAGSKRPTERRWKSSRRPAERRKRTRGWLGQAG